MVEPLGSGFQRPFPGHAERSGVQELSPLLWLSNWMSFLNGSALLSTKSSGFAGTETLEELNFVARFQLQASPAVMARGMFGMLRYDATASLKDINVPALILAGIEIQCASRKQASACSGIYQAHN